MNASLTLFSYITFLKRTVTYKKSTKPGVLCYNFGPDSRFRVQTAGTIQQKNVDRKTTVLPAKGDSEDMFCLW